MARIFSYGKLARTSNKTDLVLPGEFVDAQGVRFSEAGWMTDGNDVEFGEIVEITGRNGKALQIKRVAAATITAARAGFVIRDIVGGRVIQQGVIEGIKGGTHVPATVIPASSANGWGFAIAVGEAVAAGDQVYVGKGTNGKLLGVAYKTSGDDTVAITGWKFTSASYKPTSSDSLAAFVGKE